MPHDATLRVVRATLVALVCFLVCLASGMSPASASTTDRHVKCEHTRVSCDDRDPHHHRHHGHGRHHGKPPVPPSQTPSPTLTTPRPPFGSTPGGHSPGGGKPTESQPATDSSLPTGSATRAGIPSTSARSNPTGSAASPAARPPAVLKAPAGLAALGSGSPAQANQEPTLQVAPTGGGQLPDVRTPAPPVRTPAATATPANPASRSPVVTAALEVPRSDSMFGINSSVLLAAMLVVFALGVTVMVAGGHRGVRRTH